MPRVISSAQTFFAKFIVLVLRPPQEGCHIDANGLVISNYLREARAPWRHIVELSGSRWVNTRQVTITFDRETGFGTSVVFMPKFQSICAITQELRDIILAKRAPQ